MLKFEHLADLGASSSKDTWQLLVVRRGRTFARVVFACGVEPNFGTNTKTKQMLFPPAAAARQMSPPAAGTGARPLQVNTASTAYNLAVYN